MYSGAVYSMDPPKRGDANVDSMSMMVVDYDNSQGIGLDSKCSGLPTLPQDVEPELAGNAYAFHSTHSHGKDWPRWRLVIPFDRLVSRTEWPIVFNYVFERILGSDLNIDTTCKDLSRAYWQPACTKDTIDVAFTGYQEGELLNIDEIMDQMQTTISPEFMAAMADNVVNLVTKQAPKLAKSSHNLGFAFSELKHHSKISYDKMLEDLQRWLEKDAAPCKDFKFPPPGTRWLDF